MGRKIIGGREFSHEYIGNKSKFNITNLAPIPDILYRYYSLADYVLNSLEVGELYVNHPIEFNDIYDCHDELIQYDDPGFFKNKMIARKYSPEEMEAPTNEMIASISRYYRELYYSYMGVICFSSNPKNKLMWAYYNNNKGFQIAYDWRKFEFIYHGPFELNYQPVITPISLKEVGIEVAILYQGMTKHDLWKHEDEWRILVQPPDRCNFKNPYFEEMQDLPNPIDRKVKCQLEAIKFISLGNNFFYYKELKPNDNILKITLKENITNKYRLLSFIAESGIECKIAKRCPDLITIGYYVGKLEKGDNNTFDLHYIREE